MKSSPVVIKRSLPRRAFLRGAGAALALPFLDAMTPALTAMSRTAAAIRPRIGFVYVPNGIIMDQFTPATVGADFEIPTILKPLEPYRDSLTVVSNLVRAESNNNHAVSSGCWLTGTRPKRTDGPDFRIGTSVDQLIARQIGQDTVFPSLEVATEDFSGLLGACDPGYSCAYMNTLNWQTPTSPLPMEINPRVVFDRMFGGGATVDERLARMRVNRSILDFVSADLRDLGSGLGARDRARLDEYLNDVREIERRIQRSEAQAHNSPDVPPEPVGVPETFEEHVSLMFDLMALAWQSDLTRVFTFMVAREVSQRTYPNLGVAEPHHAVSHHGNRPESIANHTKINTYHMQLVSRFIKRLDSTPDGDGSLLDHAAVVYGSGMSDGNGHTGSPLPLAIIGKGAGRLRGNNHVKTPQGTPMANVLLSLSQKFNVEQDTFGVSTGTIDI
ncbi:MAG TPA: DUF1552 domain-containing protein [Terriglobia bacterium]|nr:DUF1552 domain-containing protein [Terriglobia bacterium]